jgi:hypothetical protein
MASSIDLIFIASSSGMVILNSSSSVIINSTISSDAPPTASWNAVVGNARFWIRTILSLSGVAGFESRNRIPTEVVKNQSKCPQLGQGASPGGVDGSMQIELSQIGQWFCTPSGVREDMLVVMTALPIDCSLPTREKISDSRQITRGDQVQQIVPLLAGQNPARQRRQGEYRLDPTLSIDRVR